MDHCMVDDGHDGREGQEVHEDQEGHNTDHCMVAVDGHRGLEEHSMAKEEDDGSCWIVWVVWLK